MTMKTTRLLDCVQPFTVAMHEHDLAMKAKRHPLRDMLHAWEAYADDYRKRYETRIGDDGVLGGEWEAIGHALVGLLNGETGGLDCGSIDSNVRDLLEANGCAREW